MQDFNQRPQLPPEKLMAITNVLARWLPGGNEMSVAHWAQPEWEAALWVVYWQNALPWLADRVAESGIVPPEDVNGRLQAINRASRERTRVMLDACTEILAAFRQAGIETILLKGAVLAPLIYPNPLQRPLADLDLLIRPQNVAASREIMLNQLGYRYYSRSAEDEVYLRGERKENIWAPDNVHPVEVHFTLREEYAGIGYELAEILWRESEERPYWHPSTIARIPNPAALLLHVCAHTSSDWIIQRGRLMHINDIRHLCTKMQPADWKTFEQLMQPGTARFIYPALVFVGKYTELAIPSETLNRLRENCPPALLHWLAHTELAEASESNPTNRSGIGLDIARRLARSPLDITRFWLRSFFPRRYNLAKRYPRLVETPFWWLGYVLINWDRAWHMVSKRLKFTY